MYHLFPFMSCSLCSKVTLCVCVQAVGGEEGFITGDAVNAGSSACVPVWVYACLTLQPGSVYKQPQEEACSFLLGVGEFFPSNVFLVRKMNPGLSVCPFLQSCKPHVYPVAGHSVAQKEAEKRCHCSFTILPLVGVAQAAKQLVAPQLLVSVLEPWTIQGKAAECLAPGHYQ